MVTGTLTLAHRTTTSHHRTSQGSKVEVYLEFESNPQIQCVVMKLFERSGKSKSNTSRNLMTAFKILIASHFLSYSLTCLHVVFPQKLRERRAPSERTKAQTAQSTTETKLKEEEEDDDDSPAKLCSSVDLDKVRACAHCGGFSSRGVTGHQVIHPARSQTHPCAPRVTHVKHSRMFHWRKKRNIYIFVFPVI